jgi:energy-coupling factor transporter transmembrane protein EcfT
MLSLPPHWHRFDKATWQTFVTVVVAAVFLGTRHVGFMSLLCLPFLAVWLLYSAYVIVRYPLRRTAQTVRVAMWVVGAMVIVGIHSARWHTTRSYANTVVTAIRAYTQTHGGCPPTLAAIGISPADFKDVLGLSSYQCHGGISPSLAYAVPYIIYETYRYDFPTSKWVHDD